MTYLDKDFWIAHKLLSFWVCIFWGAVGGLFVFLPALQGLMSTKRFGELCLAVSISFALARFTNQPGAN